MSTTKKLFSIEKITAASTEARMLGSDTHEFILFELRLDDSSVPYPYLLGSLFEFGIAPNYVEDPDVAQREEPPLEELFSLKFFADASATIAVHRLILGDGFFQSPPHGGPMAADELVSETKWTKYAGYLSGKTPTAGPVSLVPKSSTEPYVEVVFSDPNTTYKLYFQEATKTISSLPEAQKHEFEQSSKRPRLHWHHITKDKVINGTDASTAHYWKRVGGIAHIAANRNDNRQYSLPHSSLNSEVTAYYRRRASAGNEWEIDLKDVDKLSSTERGQYIISVDEYASDGLPDDIWKFPEQGWGNFCWIAAFADYCSIHLPERWIPIIWSIFETGGFRSKTKHLMFPYALRWRKPPYARATATHKEKRAPLLGATRSNTQMDWLFFTTVAYSASPKPVVHSSDVKALNSIPFVPTESAVSFLSEVLGSDEVHVIYPADQTPAQQLENKDFSNYGFDVIMVRDYLSPEDAVSRINSYFVNGVPPFCAFGFNAEATIKSFSYTSREIIDGNLSRWVWQESYEANPNYSMRHAGANVPYFERRANHAGLLLKPIESKDLDVNSTTFKYYKCTVLMYGEKVTLIVPRDDFYKVFPEIHLAQPQL